MTGEEKNTCEKNKELDVMLQSRKKQKKYKPLAVHMLSEDDIEQIFTQVIVSIEEILDKVKSNKKGYEQVTNQLEELR